MGLLLSFFPPIPDILLLQQALRLFFLANGIYSDYKYPKYKLHIATKNTYKLL